MGAKPIKVKRKNEMGEIQQDGKKRGRKTPLHGDKNQST